MVPLLLRGTRSRPKASGGFTLTELLTAIVIVSVVAVMAAVPLAALYEEHCLKSSMTEIAAMIREAKCKTIAGDTTLGIGFNPAVGTVSLIADRGPDGSWNTGDDRIVRSIRLTEKGGGLAFGYGSHGPLPGLAATTDGVTFQSNNTLVCNTELTGNAGTVYLVSRSGVAMALSMNSRDLDYTLWRWNGSKWERL